MLCMSYPLPSPLVRVGISYISIFTGHSEVWTPFQSPSLWLGWGGGPGCIPLWLYQKDPAILLFEEFCQDSRFHLDVGQLTDRAIYNAF